MTDDLKGRLLKRSTAVFLATEEGPATDLSDHLKEAAARISELEAEIENRPEQILFWHDRARAAEARNGKLIEALRDVRSYVERYFYEDFEIRTMAIRRIDDVLDSQPEPKS
jgi:hypothetical protein